MLLNFRQFFLKGDTSGFAQIAQKMAKNRTKLIDFHT